MAKQQRMFDCWSKKLSKPLNLYKMTADATNSTRSDWTLKTNSKQ